MIPRVDLLTEFTRVKDHMNCSRYAIGYLHPASGAWLANHELDNKRALGLAEPLKRRSSL